MREELTLKRRDEHSGQMHTIEGFTGGFLIIIAMTFGLQATAITPTSSSTASQEVELHNSILVDDILAEAKASGDLKDGVLNWNETGDEFKDTAENFSYYIGTDTSLDKSVPGYIGLNESLAVLDRRGIAYNIEIVCYDETGEEEVNEFVFNGEESINAVTSSVDILLNDQDRLADGTRLGDLENDPSTDFERDVCAPSGEDSEIYNIATVRITAWRM